MARTLAPFIDQFVQPLLQGGTVDVGPPIRPKDRDLMLQDAGALMDPQLRFARLRRAQWLTANPALDDPDHDELSLWIGLHNTLVFDHPERPRVWARQSTWRRVEGATRTFLSLTMPRSIPDALARHLSVGAFLELRRVDTIVTTATGDVRFCGQPVPRRRLRFSAVPQTGHREEVVRWAEQPHASESDRLLEDAMRASPLTCLLVPRAAPPGWSPLHAEAFVRDRAFCRAVCHTWAASPQWIERGGAVTGALLASLPRRPDPDAPPPAVDADGPLALPGAVVPTDPEAIGAVVGALVHLHFLKVLELDARLGVAAGSRDPGVQAFLALPLVLPWLSPRLGTPLPDELDAPRPVSRHETQIARRWGEYLEHLEELVPKSTVENLLAALVPRIVQTS